MVRTGWLPHEKCTETPVCTENTGNGGDGDVRPSKLTIRSKVRRRRKIQEKRTPQIRHERLKNREVKEEYTRKVEEKWRETEGERSEEGTN